MSSPEVTVVEPRTIQVGIVTAAQTATYQLAPGLAQYVQAVYAEVTNASGVSVRPTLTISEQSGVVIAKQRQASSIPTAQSGSATWALRLDDDTSGTGVGGIQFDTDPQAGTFLFIETTGFDPLHGSFGTEFLADNGGGFHVDATGNGAIILDINSAAAEMLLRHNHYNLYLDSGEAIDMQGGTIDLSTPTTEIHMTESGGITADLPANGSFTIQDSQGSNDFEMLDNGATGVGLTVDTHDGTDFFARDHFLLTGDTIDILASGSGTDHFLAQGRAVVLTSTVSTVGIVAATDLNLTGSSAINVNGGTGEITINIGSSTKHVIVKDHSGNKIFQIDDDGSLHGKTGKSLVFDL